MEDGIQAAQDAAVLDGAQLAHTALALLVLACVAAGVYVLARFVVARVVRVVLRKVISEQTAAVDRSFLRHLAAMAFWLVWQLGIAMVPGPGVAIAPVVRNVALAMLLLHGMLAAGALLTAMASSYRVSDLSRTRSIKGYFEVGKIALYVLGSICVIAALIDRSPVILLSGLGAMSAVTMLVFKDTILSFVAGILIASNDMLRVGDWIEMQQVGADGDVIDIALHTVKVQNWDKTITAIPTHRLISESFRNWRGMRESGGRRIKRSIKLDVTSIGFLDEAQLQRLEKLVLLRDYLSSKAVEIGAWNANLPPEAESDAANCRRLTNVGTFRAYILAYLKSHSGVHQDMTCMVRQLAAENDGLPMEIYCFTSTVLWAEYEKIQSDIFDHLFSILPEFSLRAFQDPSGYDMRQIRG